MDSMIGYVLHLSVWHVQMGHAERRLWSDYWKGRSDGEESITRSAVVASPVTVSSSFFNAFMFVLNDHISTQ